MTRGLKQETKTLNQQISYYYPIQTDASLLLLRITPTRSGEGGGGGGELGAVEPEISHQERCKKISAINLQERNSLNNLVGAICWKSMLESILFFQEEGGKQEEQQHID